MQRQKSGNSLRKYGDARIKASIQQVRTAREAFLIFTKEEARRGSATAITLLEAMAR
ncbi:hypothetical protein KIN20_013742 [Parelaphostrongylus tenuis]|uniref:Uncharacterized protein n=1 Tax=Parelaphostrongylus tenuis TaxID=148309 RepID=A0AAD5MXY5_PARTN|nr:hypothetical protein KIN20_013742 [Parelaphostrongylus tenuis]